MNREIKFRAWDTKNKHMISVAAENLTSENFELKVLGCELMQFTGLLDKLGKEIYEGDVVRTKDDIRFVKKDSGGFGTLEIKEYEVNWLHTRSFEWLIETIENRSCEIIGNIYENPELIREQVRE